MLDKIKTIITQHIGEYMEIVKDLYEHPEIGKEEIHAQALLCTICEQAGFKIEKGIALETDFVATYEGGGNKDVVAFLCEYDALPEVGHGCGHNMISAISIAAAKSLKEIMQGECGTIKIIGTPAEENFGGKIALAEKGVFKNVDLALMVHPADKNQSGGRTLALQPLQFDFYGKSAHACRPENGASALDGAVATFQSINMLRQFCAPHTFIHGVIKHGGEAANVIPEFASLQYYFRGIGMDYILGISKKATEMAESCAKMHDLKLVTTVYETPYEDCQINYTLAQAYQDNCIKLGRIDTQGVDETPCGSSDIGVVSYQCPTLHGYIKICNSDVLGHSKEMADATISESAPLAIIDSSSALAHIAYMFLTDASFKEQVQKEFRTNKSIK